MPAGTKPLFLRDPDLLRETDKLAAAAAEGYVGTAATPEASKADEE